MLYKNCLVCGRELYPKATGRKRKFCSNKCRQADYRKLRVWAKAAVEAGLDDKPEPGQDWRKGKTW